jgi:hypothetical protein
MPRPYIHNWRIINYVGTRHAVSGRERTIILQPAIGRGFTHKNPAKVRTRGPGNLDARIGRNNAVTSLLSETHIAVLKANRIVASMEDAWSLLQT